MTGIALVVLTAVALLTWALTGLLRRYALRAQMVDIPNERSSHDVPTPRGAGLAIGAVVLSATALLYGMDLIGRPLQSALLLGGTGVLLIGWLDDMRSLPAAWRGAAYLLVSFLALLTLGGLPAIDIGPRQIVLGPMGGFAAAVALAWLINLYNFMDGTDALAGVEALSVALYGGVLFAAGGDAGGAWLCATLAAACAGFLYWNWPPARIFMGDAGSCVIGFTIGVLAVTGEKNGAAPILAWVILLSIFICDATLTLLRRVIAGERWYSSHRTHAYQLLVQSAIPPAGGDRRHDGDVPALGRHPVAPASRLRRREASMIFNKRGAIIVHDLFMAALAWQLAWWARFNFEFPFPGWWVSVYAVPFIVAVQGVIFFHYRLYRGRWRFASIPDLWNIVRASLLGALCVTLTLFILFRLQGVPRSILILYPFFLMFCLGGPRLTYRFLKDRKLSFDTGAVTTRVLIFGAGRAGEMLVREMLRGGQYFPVGFVDDRRDLLNSEIHGVRVLGAVDSLVDICKEHSPDVIVIAVPSATSEEMQRIVEHCEETGVPMRTLPGLNEMVVGGAMLRELREVSIEDLLGRARVELDWKSIESGLTGKIVMVSGGGGSIGSELCHQIAQIAPAKLVILDRSEFNLYRVHRKLAQSNPALKVAALLGDVCDAEALDRVLGSHRPQVIFHAAAFKHVPILQDHCREAVLNNVFGTATIADAARRRGCDKFVLISTDKAVNPASTLGASKRVAELLCESRNSESGTKFITVRFGNVLGSEGSAIPLFQEQIRNGGPVTVTHPEVTRYFMTTREACQLILQAGAMGRGGEVYVLDMGGPVKIAYLAEQMIKLSGAVPGRDIRIEFTGLRPGEKLFEELFHAYEQREQTAHRKIILARHPEVDRRFLESGLSDLRAACDRFDDDAIAGGLKRLTGFETLRGWNVSKVVAIGPSTRPP